nr:MAG TPA: hypothetical protein [Caudoviricetes sp.]
MNFIDDDEIDNPAPIFAPMELRAERRKICQECEHRAPMLKICRQCGCVIKSKTTFSASKCPLGKW